jgi:hypothetical protein
LKELLLVFGIDANEVRQVPGQGEPSRSGTAALEIREPGFRFQLNFDSSFNSHETSLLRVNPQELAALPPALRSRLDPRRYRYAVVGVKDDTRGDLIPPG